MTKIDTTLTGEDSITLNGIEFYEIPDPFFEVKGKKLPILELIFEAEGVPGRYRAITLNGKYYVPKLD